MDSLTGLLPALSDCFRVRVAPSEGVSDFLTVLLSGVAECAVGLLSAVIDFLIARGALSAVTDFLSARGAFSAVTDFLMVLGAPSAASEGVGGLFSDVSDFLTGSLLSAVSDFLLGLLSTASDALAGVGS